MMSASENLSLMMETTKLTSLLRSRDRLACAWSSIILNIYQILGTALCPTGAYRYRCGTGAAEVFSATTFAY
jgi:hypothetical protein